MLSSEDTAFDTELLKECSNLLVIGQHLSARMPPHTTGDLETTRQKEVNNIARQLKG